jgi:hypothetical protein
MFRTMPYAYPTGVGTIGPRMCACLVDLPKTLPISAVSMFNSPRGRA